MLRLVPPALALLALLVAPASAQPGPVPMLPATEFGLSDATTVSLLTMLPGDEAYSLFGHSALRIHDDASGIDRTYNFGTFDFDQPFFVLRFLRGSLDYQLATAPFDLVLYDYQRQERPIIEQTLSLDADAARALYDVLETNALPENRAYRYDFFWDNCSTRLLGALDSALARTGQPPVALPPPDDPQTFRALLEPYIRGAPAIETGIDLGLGLPADAVATAREETFLPVELAAQLDRATAGGRPLVTARDTLFWVDGAGAPERSAPWPVWLGWLLFGGIALASLIGWRRGLRLDRLDAALFGTVGVAGLILLLLWTATSHTVTGPNLNLLWAWPTHLGAAWAARRGRWRFYFAASAVVTAAVVLGWSLWPQALPAAALPVALGLALRSALRTWRPATHPVSA